MICDLECGSRASCGFHIEKLKLGLSCVYNHSNGLGRIRTSYFAGKSEVSLVRVMFWNAEVYTKVDFMVVVVLTCSG